MSRISIRENVRENLHHLHTMHIKEEGKGVSVQHTTSCPPPRAPMLRVLYLCEGWGGGGVGAPGGHQRRHQVTGFPVASVGASRRTGTAAVAARLMFLQTGKYFF